jgi:hypothetical protein
MIITSFRLNVGGSAQLFARDAGEIQIIGGDTEAGV